MNKNICIMLLLSIVCNFMLAQQTFRVSNYATDFLPIGLNDAKGFVIYEIIEDEKYDYIEFNVFNNNLQKRSTGRIKVDLGTEITQFTSNDTHFCFSLKNVEKANFKILVFNLEGQNVGKKTYSKRRNKDIRRYIDDDVITPKVAAGKGGFYLIKYGGDYKKGYEFRKVNNQLQSIWKSYNYHSGAGLQAFLKLEEDGDDILIYNALIHETDDILMRYEIDIFDKESGDYKEDIFFVHNAYSLLPNTMITEKNGDRIFAGIYYEGGRILKKNPEGVFLAKVKKNRRVFDEDEENNRKYEIIDRRRSRFSDVEFVNYDESLRQLAFNVKGDAYAQNSVVKFFVPSIYKKHNEYKTVVETYRIENDFLNEQIKNDNQLLAFFETVKQRQENRNEEYEIDEDDWLDLDDKAKKKDKDKQDEIEKEFSKKDKQIEKEARKKQEKEEALLKEKIKKENSAKEKNKKIKELLKGGNIAKTNNKAQQQTKKKLRLKDKSKPNDKKQESK